MDEMIGNYKGEVKNKVLTALFQAYHDILDYDGLKSILKEAQLLELKDIQQDDPNNTLDYFSFKKIISAQNCLLYDSSNVLFEIGKKFAFYLFPFGKDFAEIIREINDLIKTDWKVDIIELSESNITIKVCNCIFCSQSGVPCDLFIGFLVNSLEKSLYLNEYVIMEQEKKDTQNSNHNCFTIKLKIGKKELNRS